MPAGYPTKYNDQIIPKMEEYLAACPDEIPSVVGLAVFLEVTTKTLYNWGEAEEREKYLHTLDRIADAQHLKALNKGITGEFAPTIAKLVLNNHGYADKQETELKGSINYSDMTEGQLDSKLAALMNART